MLKNRRGLIGSLKYNSYRNEIFRDCRRYGRTNRNGRNWVVGVMGSTSEVLSSIFPIRNEFINLTVDAEWIFGFPAPEGKRSFKSKFFFTKVVAI